MTLDEIEQVVLLGREERTIEFKGPGAWTDPGLRASIIRACIAMANTRDGGVIVIGMVSDASRPGLHAPSSLDDAQAAGFTVDAVLPIVNAHCSPHLELAVTVHKLGTSERLAVIEVREFRDVAVLVVRDIVGNLGRCIASRGNVLIRSRRMHETTQVQDIEDWRELLMLVADKGLEDYFRRRSIEERTASPDPEGLFRQQLGPLSS